MNLFDSYIRILKMTIIRKIFGVDLIAAGAYLIFLEIRMAISESRLLSDPLSFIVLIFSIFIGILLIRFGFSLLKKRIS